ncbi:MAG TPA: extracellular solute-binding protein [Casimicrobiaceae bacterium]|nr:extracellular solute-binding protein [Casimicrobiaceae bacterium]
MRIAHIGVSVLLLVTTAAFAAPLVGGVDVESARREGSVTLYSALSIESTAKLCAGFESKFGVKCEYYRAPGIPLMDRFRTEAMSGNLKADVLQASVLTAFQEAKAKGWLAKYTSPEGTKYLKAFSDPDGYFVSAYVIPMAIAYNPRLVAEADRPKTWQDLLDPKWRGKLTTADPTSSGTGLAVYYFWESHLGLSYIERLAKNQPLVVSATPAVANAVVSGERPVGAGLDSWEVLVRERANVPIAALFPAEGVPVVPSPVAVAAHSPHPNAAQLLMHYIISADGQKLLMDEVGTYSARTDMPPLSGMPPLDHLKLIDLDWAKLQKSAPESIAHYRTLLKEGAEK